MDFICCNSCPPQKSTASLSALWPTSSEVFYWAETFYLGSFLQLPRTVMGTPHCTRGDLCRSCQHRQGQPWTQGGCRRQKGAALAPPLPPTPQCSFDSCHPQAQPQTSETSSLWLLCWVGDCFVSEVGQIFGCFSPPRLICLPRQHVQQKQEEGPPQTFPWCAHCCLFGSSADAMLFSRTWCLAGEHPGEKGCWKIAVAATVATDGASNLSLGEYQICYSSQLFGGSLLGYVSSDVCTVLWPAMYMPDSSGSPHRFALEQQQHAQMLSRGFADSGLEQPKNVKS